MSTLSLRKIKHDSSSVDNITLNSSGHVTTAERVIVNGATTNTNSNWGYYINPKSGGAVGDFTVTRPDGNVSWLSIDGSGRVTMPYQPTFFAYGATNTNNTVCVYPSTTVNKGSCYNTSNGRFTAPISGTYYIVWGNLSSNANDVYRFYLRKNGAQGNVGNGDVHCRLDTGATGSEYIQGSRSYMLNLVAGDYLDIYLTIDSGNSPHSGSDYHWFSGWLHS